MFLNTIKATYEKPIANTNGEKLKGFPEKSGIRQEYSLYLILFNIVLEDIATAIKQGKEAEAIKLIRRNKTVTIHG